MNQDIRIAMEREILGETVEERINRFYYIMKIMNECGEIEFLHALSSVCIEKYHNECILLDEAKKRQWITISQLSTVLKNKLMEQMAS
jgi:hypothetical protein